MTTATITTAEALATQALALPCTGQSLRTALQARDLRMLDDMIRPLRVAGYRFEPQQLAIELLQSGCASVADAFGHRVRVRVCVPPCEAPMKACEASRAFTPAL
jgi:hypothetical protein